jgi:hypothetical protein
LFINAFEALPLVNIFISTTLVFSSGQGRSVAIHVILLLLLINLDKFSFSSIEATLTFRLLFALSFGGTSLFGYVGCLGDASLGCCHDISDDLISLERNLLNREIVYNFGKVTIQDILGLQF